MQPKINELRREARKIEKLLLQMESRKLKYSHLPINTVELMQFELL